MEKLFQLLHELVDHAVEQGNKHGALHALVDEVKDRFIEDLSDITGVKITLEPQPAATEGAELAQTGDAAQS